MWSAHRQRKIRKTFHSYSAAVQWRRETLRAMYVARLRHDAGRPGRLGEAYAALRKTSQELDRAMRSEPNRRIATAIQALQDDLFRVEDNLAELLTRGELVR